MMYFTKVKKKKNFMAYFNNPFVYKITTPFAQFKKIVKNSEY